MCRVRRSLQCKTILLLYSVAVTTDEKNTDRLRLIGAKIAFLPSWPCERQLGFGSVGTDGLMETLFRAI
jgi:hypothetical protein